MKAIQIIKRGLPGLLGALMLAPLAAAPPPGPEIMYGRLSGVVEDPAGAPLMGATVLISGPRGVFSAHAGDLAERVITDAEGKFVVEHLAPGWYSLRVISLARVPVMRDHVRVNAGETSDQKFVLTDVFEPIRFRIHKPDFSTWGNDWKWILRTSSASRPILRFQERQQASAQPGPDTKVSRQRLVAMVPQTGESGSGEGTAQSYLVAYSQTLSPGSDLVVFGSLSPGGVETSSLGADYREGLQGNNTTRIGLVIHRAGLADATAAGEEPAGVRAQAVEWSYSETRQLFEDLKLTTGIEVDYFDGPSHAKLVKPRLSVEYRLDPSTRVSFDFGAPTTALGEGLLGRVREADAFPRMMLRGGRARLENPRHTELSYDHRLRDGSEIELGVYRDTIQDATLRGTGQFRSRAEFAGDVAVNPATGGVLLDGGNYQGAGTEAVFIHPLGPFARVEIAYRTGHALAMDASSAKADLLAGWRGSLRSRYTPSASTKVTAFIPASKTEIVTSYTWIPYGIVTRVDPYGRGAAEVQPFLGLQVRQPIPTFAFFPAHLEALADFENLLDQGSVPMAHSGDQPFLLLPAVRSFRGGFSVLF